MKKILIVILAMLILTGCTAPGGIGVQSPDPGGDVTSTPTAGSASGDLMAGITAAEWPDPPDQIDSRFHTPMMNFAWEMFQTSAANDGNVLISPTSIYLALAMTMNGADGDTLTAMQTALQSRDLSMDDINAACRDWISLLRTETEKTSVSVVNSIWFYQEYPVSADFLQTDADYFDAGAQALDLYSSETVDIINGWVREQTHGKIDKIIEEIEPNTVMFLINAVYFKSDWQTPFSANNTTEGGFSTPDGTVTVDYMHRTGEMSYMNENGVQGVLLPYEDGRYSFFAVLPPEGEDVRTWISGLDGETVAALIATMDSGEVNLILPKFETSYDDDLREELTAMGMGQAFDEVAANFSKMNAHGQNDLYIDHVLHKTYCRVDEQGTEAAAVTSVEIETRSMPMDNIRISFDRSFVYGIVDRASGTPLFLGIMENPAS